MATSKIFEILKMFDTSHIFSQSTGVALEKRDSLSPHICENASGECWNIYSSLHLKTTAQLYQSLLKLVIFVNIDDAGHKRASGLTGEIH